MQNIRIVADSTCDIDPVLLQGEELEILPLTITIGEKIIWTARRSARTASTAPCARASSPDLADTVRQNG